MTIAAAQELVQEADKKRWLPRSWRGHFNQYHQDVLIEVNRGSLRVSAGSEQTKRVSFRGYKRYFDQGDFVEWEFENYLWAIEDDMYWLTVREHQTLDTKKASLPQPENLEK